jgi:hypothetical protein
MSNLTTGTNFTNECCERCNITTSRLCCRVCSPHSFTIMSSHARTLPPKPTRSRRKKIAKYSMEDRDHRLHDDLIRWRRDQQMKEGFGADIFFGPQRILSDQVLDRIVDLAHHSKIISIETLGEQTLWKGTLKYGKEILALIRAHAPPTVNSAPAGPSTSRSALLALNSNDPSSSSQPYSIQFVFESGITEPVKRLPSELEAIAGISSPIFFLKHIFLRFTIVPNENLPLSTEPRHRIQHCSLCGTIEHNARRCPRRESGGRNSLLKHDEVSCR